MNSNISNLIEESLQEIQQKTTEFCNSSATKKALNSASELLINVILNNGKIITCGNGGSCCDAMHFAEELTGRYRFNRQPIPAISIADPSHITCVGNDYGFENIYSRYIQGVGNSKDALFAISTSGKSKNILEAVKVAKLKGLKVIVLCGGADTEMTKLADIAIRTPTCAYSDRVQEIHIKCIHMLVQAIELGVQIQNKREE